MANNTISMSEVKTLLNYTIDNNKRLEDESKTAIAVGIEASAGIGKTSIVKQVAEERGMGFTKIDLHQLDESGDLVGFPMTEYECQILKRYKDEKDGKDKVMVLPQTVWTNKKQLDEGPGPNMKYRQTGKTRMAYAKPAWVPEYNENGNILLLDDYVRANPQLLQASMDLVLEQMYISWKLPKKTTIVLTNNPDDGNYNVSSLDEAQRTRFLNYELAFELSSWMSWAEKNDIDGRCINFVASYSNELFNADEEGNRICNPRSFVMFANMIAGLKDWDNADTLSFINLIARGCFKDNGRFAQMFSSFLRNKMHLLIQPKKMLLGDWNEVKNILDQTVYDQSTGQYRPDIASLLERRFTSYVDAWLDSPDKTPIEKVKKRIIDFLDVEQTNGRRFFTKDQFYHMIKTITSEHKRQTGQLLYEPKIAKIIS